MTSKAIFLSITTFGWGWSAVAAFGQQPGVTYNRDVLPILQKHCQTCHRPGQIGPMSFLTYQSTRPWAKAMKTAVATGKMPPWFADRSESQAHFADDRSLMQSEIETIAKWADSGAAEGDAKDVPPAIQWPADGWQIKPDVVVKGPQTRVPAKTSNNVIEWKYTYVPSGFTKDTWVTSIEVRPGSRTVTHHVCMWFQPHLAEVVYNVPQWVDRPRDVSGNEIPVSKGQQRGFNKAAIGAGDGFTCWVPGTVAQDFRPFNAGRLVHANTDLVFQVHYNPNGTGVVDQPEVGFTIAKQQPEKHFLTMAIQPVAVDSSSFAIPPNSSNWEAPLVETTFLEDSELVWMMPHMHFRGKDMTYRLVYPDGKTDTLLTLKGYNYNWQLGYDITPIKVPKGTKLSVSAHYDNSPNNKFNPDPNQTVYYGDMAWEEMDAPFFAITVDRKVNPKTVLSRGAGGGGA